MEGVIACAALLGMKGAVIISLSDTGLCVKGASRLENKLCMKAKQQEMLIPEDWSTAKV